MKSFMHEHSHDGINYCGDQGAGETTNVPRIFFRSPQGPQVTSMRYSPLREVSAFNGEYKKETTTCKTMWLSAITSSAVAKGIKQLCIVDGRDHLYPVWQRSHVPEEARNGASGRNFPGHLPRYIHVVVVVVGNFPAQKLLIVKILVIRFPCFRRNSIIKIEFRNWIRFWSFPRRTDFHSIIESFCILFAALR